MATEKELSNFLIEVERRAFRRAAYAVRNDEAALDIVQEAMMRLAERYGDKPMDEVPLLFQRILSNAILDHFRREKSKNAVFTNLSDFSSGDEDGEAFDLLETFEAEIESQATESASESVSREQVLAAIQVEVENLPPRQREAFLMRYVEELDVAETAEAMNCSEGSVKTHCSRATHSLAKALKAKGISL